MVGGGLQGVSKGSNLIVWLIKLTDINEWKNLKIKFGHLSSIVNSISIIVLLKLTIWLLKKFYVWNKTWKSFGFTNV